MDIVILSGSFFCFGDTEQHRVSHRTSPKISGFKTTTKEDSKEEVEEEEEEKATRFTAFFFGSCSSFPSV